LLSLPATAYHPAQILRCGNTPVLQLNLEYHLTPGGYPSLPGR